MKKFQYNKWGLPPIDAWVLMKTPGYPFNVWHCIEGVLDIVKAVQLAKIEYPDCGPVIEIKLS